MAQKTEHNNFATEKPALNYTLKLRRIGCDVHVILGADDEYSAMILFDNLVKHAETGGLNLSASTLSS